MAVRTPHRLRTTRRIRLNPGSILDAEDVTEEWFSGDIIPPSRETVALETVPPRDQAPYRVQWPAGAIGPGTRAPTRPAERVESGSRTYEILGMPRELRSGRRSIGVEVAVMPIDLLYPYTLELQDQGGAEVDDAVPLALWGDATDRADRGQYLTFSAEAPIHLMDELLIRNRQFILDEIPLRIVDVHIIYTAPRVRMTLRGPSRGPSG